MLGILLTEILHPSFLVKGEPEGWHLDVYTQKQPYSGAGPGEPSDSFAPQQTVFLYANITYNLSPVRHIPVSFLVQGPSNPVQNYSMSFSAVTDTAGKAETNFTLPWPPENPETATFGLWKVTAYAENVSDYLFFEVGWIIDLISLSVLEYDPPQGGWIEAQVSLTNIALTVRNATLAFISFDSLGRIINTHITEEIQVNVEGINFSIQITIPYWAAPGTAMMNVSAYTPYGDPHSPTTLSAAFQISLVGDVNGDHQVDMQDIGIVSLAYGSHLGHPRFNPLADVNKDDKVDLWDIALVARNFGKNYS